MSNTPFDFSKMFANLSDTSAMTKQFEDMFSQFKMPSVDTDAITAAQKKNLEALAASNKAAMEGTQTILKRQTEMMQAAMEGAAAAAKTMAGSQDPSELPQTQAKLVEEALTSALTNAQELSDMVRTTQEDASKAIAERFAEGMKEIQATSKA